MRERNDNTVAINLDEFRQCIETWVPDERSGYRLYLNESMHSGPSDQYLVTKYSWQNESGEIIAMGHTDLVPAVLTKEKVNDTLESEGYTALTEPQFEVVLSAYQKLCLRVMEDVIIDGTPQLYQNCLFYEVKEFGDALRQYIDDVQSKVKRAEEYEDDDEKENYYEEYLQYDRLGDDQYHNIGVISNGFDWDVEPDVPYIDHCQIACTLEFTPYESYEVRAIEHMHNGVLVNKPALALTRALMEEGLSQKEIADELGKSQSTVSRQVSQIESWFARASWTENQQSI